MSVIKCFAAAAVVLLSSADASGQTFWQELFEPWPDQHASPLDTPYVHPFFAEPAYLDRDLLIDYHVTSGVDGEADEQVVEFELEWALTKRLGILLEMPVVANDPFAGPSAEGIGDIAVGGRALLIDAPRFLLSAFIEVEIPTGDADRGLGEGEAKFFPAALWWVDLGKWTTFQGQFGPEIGLESGETEFLYFMAVTKSWQGPVMFDHACRCMKCGHCSGWSREHYGEHAGHNGNGHDDHNGNGNGHDHNDHSHHAPGLVTLYMEAVGVTPLGLMAEPTQFEGVLGVGYALTEDWELRFAARAPLFRPERLDREFIFSLLRHF